MYPVCFLEQNFDLKMKINAQHFIGGWMDFNSRKSNDFFFESLPHGQQIHSIVCVLYVFSLLFSLSRLCLPNDKNQKHIVCALTLVQNIYAYRNNNDDGVFLLVFCPFFTGCVCIHVVAVAAFFLFAQKKEKKDESKLNYWYAFEFIGERCGSNAQ